MTYALTLVPDPPRDVVAPATAHDIVLWIAVALFAVFIVYAFVEWARTRRPVLLAAAIAGLITALQEPFWGVLGLLNYREGNLMSFVLFNFRGDPLWSTLLYSLYAGGSAYLFYKLVTAGATRRQFWTGVILIFVSNLVIEIPLTALHLYDYYGNQPFQFYAGGFPLWWLFTNLGGIVSGTLLAKAVQRFGTRAAWLAIPLVPCAFGAWEVWAGWPTFFTLNLGGNLLATHLGAVVTIALSLSTVAAVAYLALPRSQARVESPEGTTSAVTVS
ncbi:hypothetical protein [Actinophytocola sp.]|jgi:hypothetical protein|uniref:hypothetical protein n=1 Tax=Actinophytocola sp. TaxID=1872138 RepID=UPI002ED785DE